MTPNPTTTRRPPIRFITGRTAARAAHVAADGAVFESVYRDLQPELSRYVRSIVRRPDVVEDVLQSVMVKALSALATEPRDFELRPWLFRIAHNEAISRLRNDRPSAQLDEGWACAGASVGELAEQSDRLGKLWSDLAGLTERQRQALVLRELNGLSHDEIGSILGTSDRAVKQTIFESRRALQECADGRDMRCEDVQRTLSDGDGRVRRGRGIRAHLGDCASCRAFDTALSTRPDELRVLAPAVPLALSAPLLLAHLIPGANAGSAASAGTAGTAGASAAATGAAGASAAGAASAATAVTLHTAGAGAGAGVGGWLGGLVATKATTVAVVAAVAGLGGSGVVAVSAGTHRPPATVSAASPQADGEVVGRRNATIASGAAQATSTTARRDSAASDAGSGQSSSQPGASASQGSAAGETVPASDAGARATGEGPAADEGSRGSETARDPGTGSSPGPPATVPAPRTEGTDRPTPGAVVPNSSGPTRSSGRPGPSRDVGSGRSEDVDSTRGKGPSSGDDETSPRGDGSSGSGGEANTRVNDDDRVSGDRGSGHGSGGHGAGTGEAATVPVATAPAATGDGTGGREDAEGREGDSVDGDGGGERGERGTRHAANGHPSMATE